MSGMVRHHTRLPDGRSLSWLEGGEPAAAAMLVWLHAFPLSSAMWRAQLDATPPGWRAIAPDLPGLGASQDRQGRPRIEDLVGDVEALLDSLSVRHAVVGGLSMGGYGALAYHRVAPGRLRGLILADTRSAADSPAGREGRERMLDTVESGGAPAVAVEMLPKLVGGTTHRSRPEVVAEVRTLIEANCADGIRRSVVRLRDRPDATPQLAHIAVPVLVLVGEEDGITPIDDARGMASRIVDSTLAVVPEAGHLSNMENPDSFNAAVRPWLAGL
jgi:pimeloyl-ACP methyl ester carboxylesterase